MQTEFDFVLPKGYVDRAGNLHRRGTMRLATAMDEIAPLRDPRVRANPAYHTVVLLTRVVTKLGNMPSIDTSVVEGLFTSDLAFLQELYRQHNELGPDPSGRVRCPSCGEQFEPLTMSDDEPAAAAPPGVEGVPGMPPFGGATNGALAGTMS